MVIKRAPKSNELSSPIFPLDKFNAEHCIKLWCPKNGIVCDPYSGSGTTMRASMNLGRKFIGSEIDKKSIKLSVDLLDNEQRKKLSLI